MHFRRENIIRKCLCPNTLTIKSCGQSQLILFYTCFPKIYLKPPIDRSGKVVNSSIGVQRLGNTYIHFSHSTQTTIPSLFLIPPHYLSLSVHSPTPNPSPHLLAPIHKYPLPLNSPVATDRGGELLQANQGSAPRRYPGSPREEAAKRIHSFMFPP